MAEISEETKNEIATRYAAGELIAPLSREYKCSESLVRRLLIKRNIQLHSQAYANRTSHNRTLNEYAFDTLTPNAAYWLGFLMADGCVSDSNNISLILAKRDINHLEKFKAFMGSTHPIRTKPKNSGSYSTEDAVRVSFNSKLVADRLFYYGVTPRKTLTAAAHPSLLHNRDFFRGLIDGDGTLGIYNSHNKSRGAIYRAARLALTGSKAITNQFASFVTSIVPSYKSKSATKVATVYQQGLGSSTAIAVISHLYTDAETYLDRKYEKAMQILAEVNA